jgi:DNA-binding MarR family transcriptional regulator
MKSWLAAYDRRMQDPPPLPALDRIPTRVLGRASLRAARVVAAHLDEVSGQRYEFAVLTAAIEAGPASQARLGQLCGIDPGDMTPLVASLLAVEHIERTRDPDDRRRWIVTVTAAGRRRQRILLEAVERAQREVFAGLSADDVATLVAMLERVATAAPPATPTRSS